MARLFIVFLIALLPLRGWTAERMVFPLQPSGYTTAVAQDNHASMGEDCALHMQAAAHGNAASKAGAEHKGCQSCQLCMPLAAWDAPLVGLIADMPHAVPLPGSSAFVSADTARHAKPPIS